MRNNDYDEEIGRGRRSSVNSSSSRESSPGLPSPKRPFSPTGSDAGEGPVPTNTQPLPDPPEARPLIRQAVAFALDKQPQNIVTYEAAPPTVLVGFLPGQQITLPPRPPRVPKEKPAPKRPKRTDAFSGQTNRFRIDTYDPTPSTAPPIAHGNGPYLSLYRGTTVPLERGPNAPHENSPASSATLSPSTTASAASSPVVVPPKVPPPSRLSNTTRNQFQNPANTQPRTATAPRSHAGSVRLGQNQQQRTNEREQPPPSTSKGHSISTASHNQNYTRPQAQSQSTSVSPTSYTPSPYYRHDYEKGVWDHGVSESPPRETQDANSQRSSHSQSSGLKHQSRDSSQRTQNHDLPGSKDISETSFPVTKVPTKGPQRNKVPLRMVTLLIQDVRSGMTDHQLAEVKVPLRLADHEGNAFWADAQDISEQLQQGPSRIDGPARVYTLRGKYRQFILRVTKNNEDEYLSANVAVSPDRTLDLVVETLSPPGAAPLPPKIPTELLGSRFEDEDQDNLSDQMDVGVIRNSQQIRDARKRANSPTFDDYDGPDSPPSRKSARGKYSHEATSRQSSQYRNSSNAYNLHVEKVAHSRGRRSVSRERPAYEPKSVGPPIPSSPRPSQAVFLKMLQKNVEDFDSAGFRDFFRSNAGNSVSEMVAQYRFMVKISKEFIGKKIDGFSDNDTVDENHLLKLMRIDDPQYLDDCKEITTLVDLYGDPSFPRYESQVTEMMARKVDAEHKLQARREFVQQLHKIDEMWNNRVKPGQRSRTSSEESGVETQRHSRTTKGMFVD